jgi:hypothetical protein
MGRPALSLTSHLETAYSVVFVRGRREEQEFIIAWNRR